MWREALRQFGVMLGGIAVGTVLVSVAIGPLTGASVGRSIAVGLYIVGSLLLLFGFFIGNRGPWRTREDPETGSGTGFGFFGPRAVRGSTADERHEAINSSALFVAMGLVLILLGVLSDPAHSLF